MPEFLNTYFGYTPENALFDPTLIPENSILYSIPNAFQTIYMAERFYRVIFRGLKGVTITHLTKLNIPWESTEEALLKASFLRSEQQIPQMVLRRFKNGMYEPAKVRAVPYTYIQNMTNMYFADIPQQQNCLAVQMAIKGEFYNCLQLIDSDDDISYKPISVTMRTTERIPAKNIQNAELGKEMVINSFCALYNLEAKVYRKLYDIMQGHYEYEYNYFLV